MFPQFQVPCLPPPILVPAAECPSQVALLCCPQHGGSHGLPVELGYLLQPVALGRGDFHGPKT